MLIAIEQADVRSLPHICGPVFILVYHCLFITVVPCIMHTGLTGMPQPISTGPLNTNSNNNNSATIGDLMPPPSHSLSHEPPVLSHPPFQATAEQ